MKEKTVKVLKVIKDGNKTRTSIEMMENELIEFQNYVGGYIEVTASIPDGKRQGEKLIMVINEEGKLRDLPPVIAYLKDDEVIDYVCGNAVFLRYDENGDFSSLRDEDISYISYRYRDQGVLTVQEEPHHVLLFRG